MIYTIICLILVIVYLLYHNYEYSKTIKVLYEYWNYNENKKWQDVLEQTGCKMVNLDNLKGENT